MYNCKEQTTGIDWSRIFKERPDLKPPGYEETVQAMQTLKQEKTNDQND